MLQRRTKEMKFPQFAIALLFVCIAVASSVAAEEPLDQTINYLIDQVRTSKLTFVRNGSTHTGAEAADHIKAKYDHFKKEIKTPEDFIRLSASKSLLTGKPYLVKMSDGKELHLDAWLTEALKDYRHQSH